MEGKKNVLIAGAGGIGKAVGLLLREMGRIPVDLYVGDADERVAREVAEWLLRGSEARGEVTPFLLPETGTSEGFLRVLSEVDLLLDCLPGREAPRMAGLARDHHLHYANLTEHVAETEKICQIAAGAETGFVLQTGLAPGFINVLGHGLFRGFCKRFGVDRADVVGMRTGALAEHAVPPHYYAFTWSPIGVSTEYLEPTQVLRDGELIARPALESITTLELDGIRYEASPTSGGVADLPTKLAGRVRELDYQTLRYPGHFGWVQGLIAGLPSDGDRPRELLHRMNEVVPWVDQDVVVIYAFVQGRLPDGTLRRSEAFRRVTPRKVGAHRLRAIQSTTAAGLAECARLLLLGRYRGVVLQSGIDPEEFMTGPFVGPIYDAARILEVCE